MANLKRAAPLLIFFIFFFLDISACPGAEQLKIFAPKDHQFAGVPVLFHIQIRNMVPPKSVFLYYRPAGVSVFHHIAMERTTALDFRVLIKAEKIIPPGIEYFFAVNDETGHTFTFPSLNPEKKPYFLRISPDENPPHLVTAEPEKGSALKKNPPFIKICFKDEETKVDVKSVRIFLDMTDISQLAEISETGLSCRYPSGLDPGRHTISVEMNDICGNRMAPETWSFTIASSQDKTRPSADIQWDGTGRYQLARHKTNSEPAWNIHSSASLKSQFALSGIKNFLDANIWYIQEEGPGPKGDDFNLNHYLYKAQHEKQSLEIGDVSVEGTELTSRSIARRGGLVKIQSELTKFQGFVLRSNAITGFDHIAGIDDPDQRLVGASLSREIIAGKKLILKTSYITGTNHEPFNYNASSLEAGTEGNIYSMGAQSELLRGKLKFEGEFCTSSYDSDISDDFGRTDDKAWFAKASGRGDSYDWDASCKYLGQDFHTIVNATGVGNRAEYHAGVRWQALSSSFRVTGLRIIDNIEKDPLMPVMKNTTGTIAYNLAKPEWPAFFCTYTLSIQNSDHEPANFSPVKNRIQSAGGGFSLSKNKWNISPSYTIIIFDDRSATTNNDSRTHVVSVSGSLRPADMFSISPSLSYTNLHTDASDLTYETWQATIGTVFFLREKMTDLNATLSYLDNKTSDGSTHTDTFNAIGQINWHIENLLSAGSRQTFSLRGQYSRTNDHVSGNITRDYSIFAVISFSFPVKV